MPDDKTSPVTQGKTWFYRSFPQCGEKMYLLAYKRGSARPLDKIGRLVQFLVTPWHRGLMR